MAKKSVFSPDEVFQMIPITEGDRDYGYAIVKLYQNSMDFVMESLFRFGATGMICNEREPQTTDFVHKLLASQFSRPEDYHGKELPGMSPGYHVSCKAGSFPHSLRWYRSIRLQGDFQELLAEDAEHEDTGTMAVTLAGNLALSGVIPHRKNDSIIVREIKIASMHADKKHEKPWLAIEFDLYVHSRCFTPMGLPRMLDTGYVPLDALRGIAESEGA